MQQGPAEKPGGLHDRPWDASPLNTVGALRHFLEAYDDTTPVRVTWEGIHRLLAPLGFLEGRLVFDVEHHWPEEGQ